MPPHASSGEYTADIEKGSSNNQGRSSNSPILTEPQHVRREGVWKEDPPDCNTQDTPYNAPGVLARVLSKTISRNSLPDPGPPPDGGAAAWTQ